MLSDGAQRPASAFASASKPRVPSLPTEIIHRIIQLSLPYTSFRTFSQRSEQVELLRRVDTRWKALAEHEAGRHVLLKTQNEVQTFVSSRRNGTGAEPTSLWIDNNRDRREGDSVRNATLREAIGACAALRRLLVVASCDDSFPCIDLDHLAIAHNLKEVALEYCHISITSPLLSESSPTFAHLTYLTLLSLLSGDDYAKILLSADLPSLEDLAITVDIWTLAPGQDLTGHDPAPSVARILEAVRHVAPRLRSFVWTTIGSWPDGDDELDIPDDFWKCFSRLEKLGLDHDRPIPNSFLRLPILHTLHLRPGLSTDLPRPVNMRIFVEAFEDPLLDWSKVRTLCLTGLDSALEYLSRPTQLSERRYRKTARKSGRSRGIHMTEREPEDWFPEPLERALEFW